MTAVTFFGEVGIAEVALTLAALAYVTHVVLDALGVSRTSKTLRVENEDLVRRNGELEQTIARLEDKITKLQEELDVLVPQVAELQQRDQRAVLTAIADHERAAASRHERTFEVLTAIRDATQTTATLAETRDR